MHELARLVHHLGDRRHDVPDVVVLRVGDDVGLPLRRRLFRRQLVRVHEVFDVDRVVEHLAVAEEREKPLLDPLVHHQKPPRIARAVERRRPQDRDVHALLDEFLRDLFALVLGKLVVVLGLDRRILVAGRILDVAVHALRAAIDDLLHALFARQLQQAAEAALVDLGVDPVGHVDLAERRGQVVHDLDAVERFRQRLLVRHGAVDDLRAALDEFVVEQPLLVVQHDDLVAAVQHPPRQMAAREARPARHQYLHACFLAKKTRFGTLRKIPALGKPKTPPGGPGRGPLRGEFYVERKNFRAVLRRT